MVLGGRPGQVWRSSGRLADGREIIYFDESPGSGRAAVPDARDLLSGTAAAEEPDGAGPAAAIADEAVAIASTVAALAGTARPEPAEVAEPGGGLRWDPLAGEWVMYAAQRRERTFRPPVRACPLCPSRPGHPTEIPAAGYDVVVFENRFPALSGTEGGRCEVICFTADHEASFGSLRPCRVRTVFEAWADRTRELLALPAVQHVYCFENRGEEIGVTLTHPHGQVYAFPFVPPRTLRLLELARAHRARTGGNLFDEVVSAELADGRRIVARNEHWTAFVPQAARWPFEVMIFPSVRVADLPAVAAPARDAFGPVYLDVLASLDALFGAPMPYIAAWQQAPGQGVSPADREEFGLHLHVMAIMRAPGRQKYLAGTESGAGAWSNDILPEAAAAMIRSAGDRDAVGDGGRAGGRRGCGGCGCGGLAGQEGA